MPLKSLISQQGWNRGLDLLKCNSFLMQWALQQSQWLASHQFGKHTHTHAHTHMCRLLMCLNYTTSPQLAKYSVEFQLFLLGLTACSQITQTGTLPLVEICKCLVTTVAR